MDKPIIAVDIDDVLADSTDALRRVINERLGVNLTPEDYLIKEDYWDHYEEVWHHKVPAHFHRCKNWRQVLEYFNARG